MNTKVLFRDNIDIFEFTLTEEEMEEIAKLNGTKKYYYATEEQVQMYVEMHLPFEG